MTAKPSQPQTTKAPQTQPQPQATEISQLHWQTTQAFQPQTTQAFQPQTTQASQPQTIQASQPQTIQASQPQTIQAPQSQTTETSLPETTKMASFKIKRLFETEEGHVHSPEADICAQDWFAQHAHQVQGESNTVTFSLDDGESVELPKMYFPTNEDLAKNAGQTSTMTFQTDMTPLRFRGMYTPKTQHVLLEVGLSPSPAVFSPLTSVSGVVRKGQPLKSQSLRTPFYKGLVSVEFQKQEAAGEAKEEINTLVAKLNWQGLGLSLTDNVIHLMKDIKL